MKSILKKIILLLLVFAFVGCNDLTSLFEEEETESLSYSAELVNDFITDISSRSLSDTDISTMKSEILDKIESEELGESEDLSKLMPIIASSAQISLKSLDSDEDKVPYIKLISNTSVSLIGKKTKDSTGEDVAANIIISVSSSMVSSISDTGISADMINTTTKATVAALIETLCDSDLDEDKILETVASIANKSSIAVANNEGATSEILAETLGSMSYTASSSVTIELSDAKKKKLFTDTYSSVIASVYIMETEDSDLDVTSMISTIKTTTTSDLTENGDDSIGSYDLDDAAADAEYLAEEIIEAAEAAAEEAALDEQLAAGDLTVAEIEEIALDLLKLSSFDKALVQFQNAVDTGNATSQGKLWWAMLTIGSISIDENVKEVANNIGLTTYPTTMKGFMLDSNDTGFNTIFPEVKNQEKFKSLVTEDGDTGLSQILAVLYNIQENYPDGLNDVVDSFMKASETMDEVIEMLLTISDDASFSYTYEMFNEDDFDPEYTDWPSETVEGTVSAIDVTLGKAEVYSMVATMEFMRAMLLMGQSISLSADFDGYWDIFNPVDGSYYSFNEDGTITGIDENFDYGTINNPISDGFLTARDDADTILASAKVKFVNSIGYIKTASELIVERDEDSEFFLSPSNEYITAETWEFVEDIQGVLVIAVDKIIDSIENGTTLYLPDFSELNGPEDLLSYTEDNWPTEGSGVNLSKLFEKPLFAIDSLFDTDDSGEFVFYTLEGTTYTKASTYSDEEDYYVKFLDTTFNGLLVDFDEVLSGFSGSLGSTVDGALYISLPSEAKILVGSSLTSKGDEYIANGETYTSTGSFFSVIISEQLFVSTLTIEDEYDDYYEDDYYEDDYEDYSSEAN